MTRILLLVFAFVASAADWSQPAEVRYEDALAISYTARFDGPYLVVRANLGQGWHTLRPRQRTARRGETRRQARPEYGSLDRGRSDRR
jgi:hypothetical protein